MVTVEVHVSNGLPAFSIVGLPEASVRESKDRVRSALLSSGFQLPAKRITVNLAPADLPKSGGRFDLAIAIGVLLASGQLQAESIEQYEFYGELALTGSLRAVPSIVPSLRQVEGAGHQAVMSVENASEATLLTTGSNNGHFWLAETLLDVCTFISQQQSLSSPPPMDSFDLSWQEDLSDVVGQHQAKRVLEISAAGEHSILMMGPPGAGKSMLASRLVTLLPPLQRTEADELASIYSLANKSMQSLLSLQRPFVRPHHSASQAALIGGGTSPKPGAISLAHHGVLFLDELPEFDRPALEALREPLESHQVEVSRVQLQTTFPANFLLVAAMNPSPSGYFPDDPLGRCTDTPDQVLRYQQKISGPLLDRIDLHLQVPAVAVDELQAGQDVTAESSQVVRERVTACRERQLHRQGCLNAALSTAQLKQLVILDSASQNFIQAAMEKVGMSARSYFRVLKLARTIADMEHCHSVELPHLAEALSYRQFDRQLG